MLNIAKMAVRNFYIPVRDNARNLEFQYASDLHIEHVNSFSDKTWESMLVPSAPNLILCGDIGSASNPIQLVHFLTWCKNKWDNVIYVPGNHEYYGTSIKYGNKVINDICGKLSVHYLNPGFIKIDNVIIMGCALWSHIPEDEARIIKYKLNDFRQIDEHSTSYHNGLFEYHKRFLEDNLAELSKQPDVRFIIATHHCPDRNLTKMLTATRSTFSGPETYDLSAAFGTDITKRFQKYSPKIIAWIYGHTHLNMSETINDIRVICNQHGYSIDTPHEYDKSAKLILTPVETPT